MTVSKISDIKAADLAEYCRIPDPITADYTTLNTLLDVAISFIEQYTGHTAEELDELPDVVIVAFILVQDMWDNRTMYVDSGNVNKVVDSILGLHSVNLL